MRSRLTIALIAASLLVACGKPYPVELLIEEDSVFFVDRFFGQPYYDDEGYVHLSAGIRVRMSEVKIHAPLSGIIEYCPLGVRCDGQEAAIRVVPQADTAAAPIDGVPLPQHLVFEGLDASSIHSAVVALQTALNEADSGNSRPPGDAATAFVVDQEALELKAFGCHKILDQPTCDGAPANAPGCNGPCGDPGCECDAPGCEWDVASSVCVDSVYIGKPAKDGDNTLYLDRSLTIVAIDPDGNYVDPFLYLDPALLPPSGSPLPLPVQALNSDTDPPVIEAIALYTYDGQAPDTAGTKALPQVAQSGGGAEPVFVATCPAAGPCELDLVARVFDGGPMPIGPNGTATMNQDVNRGVRSLSYDIANPSDPLYPTYDPLQPATSFFGGPQDAGVYCTAGSGRQFGQDDGGVDDIYDVYQLPGVPADPLAYNLTQMRRRQLRCLPVGHKLDDPNSTAALDLVALGLSADTEYEVHVTATDYAGLTTTKTAWVKWVDPASSGGGTSCGDYLVASCTASLGAPTPAQGSCAGLSMEVGVAIPASVCKGEVDLVVVGDQVQVEGPGLPSAPGPLTEAWTWNDPNDPAPWPQGLCLSPKTGALAFSTVGLTLVYSDLEASPGESTCVDTRSFVMNASGAGPLSLEPFTGGCCFARDTPGCDDEQVGHQIAFDVCNSDPGVFGSCCSTAWSQACVDEAINLGALVCYPDQSECGNGICDGVESPDTCSSDCGYPPTDANDPNGEGCPEIAVGFQDSLSLGPLTIPLPAGAVLWMGRTPGGDGLADNADDQCTYKLNASVAAQATFLAHIETLGYFTAPPAVDLDLNGGDTLDLLWTEPIQPSGATTPTQRSGTITTASLTWTSGAGFNLGNLAAYLSPALVDVAFTLHQVVLSSDLSGGIFGSLSFEFTQTAPVPLGAACLREGLTGAVIYRFDGASGWSGSWDFGGLTGLELDLVRPGPGGACDSGASVLATATADVSASGLVTATLQTGGQGFYSLVPGGVEVHYAPGALQLSFSYNLKNSALDFISGSANFTVKNLPYIEGELTADLAFTPTQVSGNLAYTGAVSLLGFTLNAISLGITMDYDFNILAINGSVSAEFSNPSMFEASFDELAVSMVRNSAGDLQLQTVTLASAIVGFRGFRVSLTNASWDAVNKRLELSAKLEVPQLGYVDMVGFTLEEVVQLSEWQVGVQKITGSFDTSLLSGVFDAFYEEDLLAGTYRFKGSAHLEILSKFSLQVDIDVGKDVTSGGTLFTFLFVYVSAQGLPIPLIPLPIKLSGILLMGGYNYDITDATDPFNIEGEPKMGNHAVGAGLTISDIFGMVAVTGVVIIEFGTGPITISLVGQLDVPLPGPGESAYFTGTVYVDNYQIWSPEFRGGLMAEVWVPRMDGSFLDKGDIIGSPGPLNIEIDIGSTGWSVQTLNEAELSILWGLIELSGSFSLGSDYTDPDEGMYGHLDAALRLGFDFDLTWPSGFHPYAKDGYSACFMADFTDHWTGFGFTGSVGAFLEANFGLSYDKSGFLGYIGAAAGFHADARWKLPCFIYCGSDCVWSVNLAAEAGFKIEFKTHPSGHLKISGYAQFSDAQGNEMDEKEWYSVCIWGLFTIDSGCEDEL